MENKEITASEGMAVKPAYTEELTSIIRSNDTPKSIMNRLEDYHGSDIADVIGTLTVQERKKFYRVCGTEMLADIFEYFDEDEAGGYLNEMEIRKAAAVVEKLDTDTAVEILRCIGKDKRTVIIDLLSADIKKEIQLIASFDEDEIGSRMTTNCIIIREGMTIKQSMNELIRQAEENDNITTLFVVDEDNEFCGAVDLKDLITARSGRPLDELVVASFPYVYANEQTADCIEKLKDYSESIIPVLDDSNKLLGVITSQNIIEAVDDEMGDDYAKFAGLTSEEDLNETTKQSMKKRMPWLLVLLGLGIVVSSVVGAFEKVVAQLTLIMAFQSLILDMAGNVGTQSLAVTIRVLTDENLSFKQKGRLVSKEMRVGLCNGLLLGSISFVLIGLYIMLFKHRTALFSFAVSGCIGLSLMIAMLISSAVGTLIPLFFKKIKVDPAVASGPLITTVNDLVAVVSYYGMSWVLLLNVLHLA
ncbi:magnesium transporter [Ruminococcus sp. YE71]|uniref:magnesium transporter n=1 Tax=unclassified Ruminococcus TaxID=2608920 RepID=UPI0008819209|nr:MULTISPECIES: magnesium transporter [unclassified Ruminococcus]SDA13470.1 magnesium transporter [Ruminococcus sp. YE78]SFW19151.1 magnesium transporter [Ruminococcus sp. YE71]